MEDGEVLKISSSLFSQVHRFPTTVTQRETKKEVRSERYSKERLLSVLMNVDCYSLLRLMEPKGGSALKIGEKKKR